MEIERNCLLSVARQAGIADRYTSNLGKEAVVSQKTIEYLLNALGYETLSQESRNNFV